MTNYKLVNLGNSWSLFRNGDYLPNNWYYIASIQKADPYSKGTQYYVYSMPEDDSGLGNCLIGVYNTLEEAKGRLVEWYKIKEAI